MMGKDSTQIRITALGLVTEIDEEDKCVYINLVASDLDRPVVYQFQSSHHAPRDERSSRGA